MSGDIKPGKQRCVETTPLDSVRHPEANGGLLPCAPIGDGAPQSPEPVALLARNLLAAMDRGSAPALLQQLSRILAADQDSYPSHGEEREGLVLLQEVANHLRTDLESMLMQIYQRLESSRACLGLIRHLADAGVPNMRGTPETDHLSTSGTLPQRDNLILWPGTHEKTAPVRQRLATGDESVKDLPPEPRKA
jgi:hypothetical protein